MTPQFEHPELEDLLRCRENTLPEDQRKAVETHLAACGRCRQEMERIAWAAQGVNVPVPSVEDLLANLSRLQSTLQQPGASGAALKQKVKSELTAYVGAEAADRILQPVVPSGENLLSTIESTLRLFLGKAATARIVSRIVDRAIVRI